MYHMHTNISGILIFVKCTSNADWNFGHVGIHLESGKGMPVSTLTYALFNLHVTEIPDGIVSISYLFFQNKLYLKSKKIKKNQFIVI